MDDAQENNASHSQKLHQMRITNHGKMHHFVEFALNHFKVRLVFGSIEDGAEKSKWVQNNSDIPLSLHTCPAAKPSANELVELPKSANALDGGIPDATERRMLVSTTTIPRLISVVEIIKREYLKTLEITQSRVLSGLYQYNEIGYLEQHESDDSIPSEDRMQVLAMALEGKNQ